MKLLISGNLNATDAEKYDKLIEEPQRNQIIVGKASKNRSLSVSLISKLDKFNFTI